ncbi:MAG TPA: ISNCY family transposase [Candidatus Sulfomarinibacteraceae bacterium]|nr:ISNCY family transposase [Candidatus Sulfomarinibacteraceae bacterium]
MNKKEQKRLLVMNEVLAGRLTGQEAADVLGLSLRQTRRLLAGYRCRGAAALMHGNRGREPANKLDAAVEAEIVRLARSEYRDYNDSHFTEELAERQEIAVSRPTVRRVRREQGLGSPRKRRAPRHRRRRQRYPQAGMLLQVDGSKHDWLEGRGPWLTLHAAIDDATNEVPWALFREEEDATGYALLLHHISHTHGLPLALYADRHTIFQSPKEPTVEEQLEGLEPRSHLGRLLDELEVGLIGARSPQAKGRVERLFGTLQDRLVKELRRAGAGSLEEANAVLQRYLPRFNQRFMKAAAQPGSAYRPCLSRAQANEQIHFTYWRTVAKDHTISLFGHVLALPDLPVRTTLAGCRLALHHRMDGRLAVVHQGQMLGLFQPAQLGPPHLEAFEPAAHHLVAPQQRAVTSQPVSANGAAIKSPRVYRKPPADHPWRRG